MDLKIETRLVDRLNPVMSITAGRVCSPKQIGRYSTFGVRRAMLTSRWRIMGLVMKLLRIVPRDGTYHCDAMNRKQAAIRHNGRGTFSRARARRRNAASNIECSHEPELEICEGCSRDTSLRSRLEFSGCQTEGRRLDRYLQGQKVASQDCTPDSLLSR